ncbi:MAG: CARDB domain-containing protein [bacterium]
MRTTHRKVSSHRKRRLNKQHNSWKWKLLTSVAIVSLVTQTTAFGLFLAPTSSVAADEEQTGSTTPGHVALQYLCTDISDNGITDLADLVFFNEHYSQDGVCVGDPRFDPRADFDGDGCTNDVDKEILSGYFNSAEPNESNLYCQRAHEFRARECPDIDENGVVNLGDLTIFGRSFGTYAGDATYNPEADFDQDGMVGVVDKAILSDAFNHPDRTSPYCLPFSSGTAHLTLAKSVVNDHGGTAVPTDWSLSAAGPLPISGFGGVSSDVDAGTYALVETGGPNGYSASAWNCTNDDQKNSSDVPPGNEVTLHSGDSVTCTITNDDIQPQLTITSVVSGGSLQPSDFPLFVNDTPVNSGVQNGFNVGSYVIHETNQSGYTAVITGDCDSSGTLTLNPGDVKTCTITNTRDTGMIIVEKNVVASDGFTDVNDPQAFSVTLDGSDQRSISESSSVTYLQVPTGLHTIAELGNENYDLVSMTDGGIVTVHPSQTTTVTVLNKQKTRVVVPPQQTTLLAPKITIDKTVNTTKAVANDLLTYSVVISNTGTAAAENLTVTDILPSGMVFSDLPATERTWNVSPSFAPGSSTTITYGVRIDGGASAGNYTNTATARAVGVEPAIDTATVQVTAPQVLGVTTGAPSLTIKKTSHRTTVNPGESVDFTIVVTNVGEGPATKVSLSDFLPEDLTFEDGTISRTWTVGTLSAKESKTFTYTTNVSDTALEGTHSNIVDVSFAEGDPLEAIAPVAVRSGRVLGVSTLAETGANFSDNLVFTSGIILLFVAVIGFRKSSSLA